MVRAATRGRRLTVGKRQRPKRRGTGVNRRRPRRGETYGVHPIIPSFIGVCPTHGKRWFTDEREAGRQARHNEHEGQPGSRVNVFPCPDVPGGLTWFHVGHIPRDVRSATGRTRDEWLGR